MADIQKLTIDGTTYDIADGSALRYKSTISSSDDLDDMFSTGTYVYNSSSIPANAPIDKASAVIVINCGNDPTVQFVIQYNSNSYSYCYRIYHANSGTWRPWREVANKDDIDTLNAAISSAQSTADTALSGLTDGSVTKVGTETVGAANQPIYLNNGVPTATNFYTNDKLYYYSSDVELGEDERTGQDFTLVYPFFRNAYENNYAYYSTQFKLQDGLLSIENGATVGSGTTPVYLNSGALSACAYPYYLTAGDTFTVRFDGAGFCTSSSTQVNFTIPISVPLRDFTSITASSQGGFILRQGGYTHGSGSGAPVQPANITYSYSFPSGIYVQATFSSTSGATNNDAIGINMADTTFVLS